MSWGYVGVSSKQQRVNLYYCASSSDGVLKRHKVYTGSGRMSLLQFVAAARIISTEKFVVGVTNGQRGIGPKSLMERSNEC